MTLFFRFRPGHFTPCIVLVTRRTRTKRTRAAPASTAVDSEKEFGRWNGAPYFAKSAGEEIAESARGSHTPMAWWRLGRGASLETIDKPTGDKHNSPSVARI